MTSLSFSAAIQTPEARHPPEKTSLSPCPSADFATTAPTILLVDDDPAVRESLAAVLATEGWQVVCAATGEDALECLAEQQPDLLITDLCLNEVSGWDLLFHESIHRPFLPVFVITGLPRRATGGADRFAAMFFPKPLDLDALVTAIRRRFGSTRPNPAP